MHEIHIGDIVCCKITGKSYLVTADRMRWVYTVRYGVEFSHCKELLFVSIESKNVEKWMKEAFINPKPSIFKQIIHFLETSVRLVSRKVND
jgi:hypothetical protein